VGALGFTLGGAWMVMHGKPYGWFVSVIFGLALIMCGALFLPGAFSLKLAQEGFVICAFWRRHTYRWHDVRDFRVIEMPHGMTVAFDFADGATRPKGSDLAVALTDADAALPDTYGIAASELAALMSAWRDRARADQPG